MGAQEEEERRVDAKGRAYVYAKEGKKERKKNIAKTSVRIKR